VVTWLVNVHAVRRTMHQARANTKREAVAGRLSWNVCPLNSRAGQHLQ
jgi:hypothetical protein